MLLDIQDFAQNQRERQELLNKEVALTDEIRQEAGDFNP